MSDTDHFKEGHLNADDDYDTETYDERQEMVEVMRSVDEAQGDIAPVDDGLTFLRYAAPAPLGTKNNRWRCGPCGAEETTDGHIPPIVCASCGWVDGMWKWLGEGESDGSEQGVMHDWPR